MNKRPQVLIADDELGARETLQSLLLQKGYDTTLAISEQDFMAHLDQLAPDVILLGTVAAGMDSFQICQRLKAEERWHHIPVVLIMGHDSVGLTQGINAGANDFVFKPVSGIELGARLCSVLRTKTLYDELGKQLRVLEILHSAGLRMMRNLDTDAIIDLLFETSMKLIPEAAGSTIHFLTSHTQRLLSFAVGYKDGSKTVYSSVGIEEIAWQAIEASETIYVPDVMVSHPHLTPRLPEIRALLATPLVDGQHQRGVLTVYGSDADALGQDRRNLLSILANQATVAMVKVRSIEQQEIAKEREKAAIRDLFQRYVSPRVVERLVSGEEELTLGGKRQEISVLFGDVRGFTALSENLAPERLIEVLNEYLALAVEAIMAQDGTLDKFMGDAVMAFFNAPLSQPDHALRAVRAAVAMQETIASCTLEGEAGEVAPLGFGLGIHTGQAVVGNVGTEQQMNYTIVGDTVNLAKRLQECAMAGQIILSQAAYEAVKDSVIVNDLGLLTVKGRAAPEHGYCLISLTENVAAGAGEPGVRSNRLNPPSQTPHTR